VASYETTGTKIDMKIHFVHAMDENNPGDWWSTPKHYFPKFKNATVSHVKNFDQDIGKIDVLVYGGGDLLSSANNKYRKWLEKTITEYQPRKLVGWGLGLSPEYFKMEGNQLLKNFDYLGCRLPVLDPNFFHKMHIKEMDNYEYVPCASCLHPVFDDNNEEIRHDIGILHHKNWPINNRWIRGALGDSSYQQIFNSPNNIENMVDFIKKSDRIITSSYHGAYWSMLLGKKTLVVKQPLHVMPPEVQDTRFKMFNIHKDQNQIYRELELNRFRKYKIPASWKFSSRTLGFADNKVKRFLHSINNWEYAVQDKNFLTECREKSKNFYSKVFEDD